MGSSFLPDPGPCPICGAEHHGCPAGTRGRPIVAGQITPATRIVVPQSPAEMAAAAEGHAQALTPEAEAGLIQTSLPSRQRFSTATYRREKRAPTRAHD